MRATWGSAMALVVGCGSSAGPQVEASARLDASQDAPSIDAGTETSQDDASLPDANAGQDAGDPPEAGAVVDAAGGEASMPDATACGPSVYPLCSSCTSAIEQSHYNPACVYGCQIVTCPASCPASVITECLYPGATFIDESDSQGDRTQWCQCP